jgi:hypothetical protein
MHHLLNRLLTISTRSNEVSNKKQAIPSMSVKRSAPLGASESAGSVCACKLAGASVPAVGFEVGIGVTRIL